MKKILSFLLLMALFISMVSATEISCSNNALNQGQNPAGTIVLCDDPTDQTCEQDFETLCPQDWHLCSSEEFNSRNDDWTDIISTWNFGKITCREGYGAGHYTVWNIGQPFSNDVPFNQYAGSSLPECQSDYGCNEKQYNAMCCYDASNGGGQEVPEFGVIAGTIALIGAIGVFVYKRRY